MVFCMLTNNRVFASMFVPPYWRHRPTAPSRKLYTYVSHLSLISNCFTQVFVEDPNHMVEDIKYASGEARWHKRNLLPCCEVPVYEVQCFEVPHARRDLCSHVQEAVKAEKRGKSFSLTWLVGFATRNVFQLLIDTNQITDVNTV